MKGRMGAMGVLAGSALLTLIVSLSRPGIEKQIYDALVAIFMLLAAILIAIAP